MAVQMWSKIGATVTLPEPTGNSNFAVVVPDKKVETQDEGAIHNIQHNAKDAGGIMYLMSLLYAHEGYVTVDGLAGFDATYNQLGEGITQTIYLNTAINKDTGNVNFEALVYTPQYNACGYTNAEFTFDFTTSTLIECRFMMGNDASLRVMKKLGMTFEGYMRDAMYVKGEYRTIGVCSILKEEYEKKI